MKKKTLRALLLLLALFMLPIAAPAEQPAIRVMGLKGPTGIAWRP